MTMGERIKFLREQQGMTQEELGEKIGVQKSAIRKYEKGEVENIKRSAIKTMATVFGVDPCYLMGWDEDKEKVASIRDEVFLLEQLQKQYGKGAVALLEYYTQLNPTGQTKAIEAVADMTEIEKYKKGE